MFTLLRLTPLITPLLYSHLSSLHTSIHTSLHTSIHTTPLFTSHLFHHPTQALHGGAQAVLQKLQQLLDEPSHFQFGSYGQEIHEMTEMRALAMGPVVRRGGGGGCLV